MLIEVFSDPVCPWCYIAKRRLDQALAVVDLPAEVVWRSFQLDPTYPDDLDWTLPEFHLQRLGIGSVENDRRLALVTAQAREAGLDYRLDRARPANTYEAHRLIKHASAHGRGLEVAEALMRAYTVEGRWIGDPEVRREIAAAAGLEVPAPDAYRDAIAADRELADRYGIRAVPTLVLDRRVGLVAAGLDDLINALAAA
ncbi:DsbA family oxidoreductase [Microlunatus speluncae]|uniref:DsbA family oxidoreductase n=1 Tax=Microlunatus speluncae TaxID=2594267 RepID=UPI001FE3D7C6|nr:DsbA family oxidoreductase [Microlunatus speluncae]